MPGLRELDALGGLLVLALAGDIGKAGMHLGLYLIATVLVVRETVGLLCEGDAVQFSVDGKS